MAINVKIIGAGGYGGVGMVELLLGHPEAVIGALVDVERIGEPLSNLYPHLSGYCDIPLVAPDSPEAARPADIVFMATPDRVGMRLARGELERGARVIDYSGDFRFDKASDYAAYATRIGLDAEHADPELLAETVYGLPELHSAEIGSDRRLVGNPGCFAVSCLLGLAPAAAEGLLRPGSVICDCKTGVSGAGKKPAPGFHYPARYEQMNAYKLAGHQHVCEIERELGLLAGVDMPVTFTSQVVPLCRGIMSCLYADLSRAAGEAELLDLYRDFYGEEGFVRVCPPDAAVGSMHVRGTNNVNLVVSLDHRLNRLRVVSYIDNLIKGQAGSAMQNMNRILGLPEGTGLSRPGQYP